MAITPDGVNNAPEKPKSPASRSSSARTVGSSPNRSSPTSAAAIAARIPAPGRVTVSLRRSTVSKLPMLMTVRQLLARGAVG